MPRETSWHIPLVSTYGINDPLAIINVVLLQQMSESDLQQVKAALETVDYHAVRQSNVELSTPLRPLKIKEWIRDYAPSSAITLQIAKVAYQQQHYMDHSFASLVFVDSGWDLGNVIAAHWEKQGEDDEARLFAARVPTGIANILLAACDRVQGLTLSQALGADCFAESQIDLYKDLSGAEAAQDQAATFKYEWPAHLPKNLSLDQQSPFIISLRPLLDATIQKLKDEINAGSGNEHLDVSVHNWVGETMMDRRIIRDLYNHMHRKCGEQNDKSYAWFIDYFGQKGGDEPQLLAVSKGDGETRTGVEVLPTCTSKFHQAWEQASKGEALNRDAELVDTWKKERIHDLNDAGSGLGRSACPIFFLQPFTREEEQRARKAVCALGDAEDGEYWGHPFTWHGYIFQDGKPHTLEDLRNLFENSDSYSPFFNKGKAGPYRLDAYPSNFVALDEKVLDPDSPKVWMASSVDFGIDDQLGWITGRVDASETNVAFMNLDIANAGPVECFDVDTIDKLWLSDLSAYREEEWGDEQVM